MGFPPLLPLSAPPLSLFHAPRMRAHALSFFFSLFLSLTCFLLPSRSHVHTCFLSLSHSLFFLSRSLSRARCHSQFAEEQTMIVSTQTHNYYRSLSRSLSLSTQTHNYYRSLSRSLSLSRTDNHCLYTDTLSCSLSLSLSLSVSV